MWFISTWNATTKLQMAANTSEFHAFGALSGCHGAPENPLMSCHGCQDQGLSFSPVSKRSAPPAIQDGIVRQIELHRELPKGQPLRTKQQRLASVNTWEHTQGGERSCRQESRTSLV